MRTVSKQSLGLTALIIAAVALLGCVPPKPAPPAAPPLVSGSNTTRAEDGPDGAGPGEAAESDKPASDVAPEPDGDEATGPQLNAPQSSRPADGISAQVADLESYQQVLAAHAGKVVLVDFWATWCPPCREQFPHTVELSRKLADRGLVAVSVSFDEPTDKEKVEQFLAENGATFQNLISQYGIGVESAEQFNILNDGALPFYKLYDRQGQLRYQFGQFEEEGVEDIDQIDACVEELLAEGAE